MTTEAPPTAAQYRDGMIRLFNDVAKDVDRLPAHVFDAFTQPVTGDRYPVDDGHDYPSPAEQLRAGVANLYAWIADNLAVLPDAAFTEGDTALDRHAMQLLFAAVGPLSTIAGGLAMSHAYPDRLNDIGQRMTQAGMKHLAGAPALRHLHECPGHRRNPDEAPPVPTDP